MPVSIAALTITLITLSSPIAANVTVFESQSNTLQQSATLEIENELLLPMSLITESFGLEQKTLTAKSIGICRDDLCIPFTVGDQQGAIRSIDDKQWVPIERLVDALRGRWIHDKTNAALLIDLSPQPTQPRAIPDGPINLTLPNLSGELTSLSDFRGKRVVLFAWASW